MTSRVFCEQHPDLFVCCPTGVRASHPCKLRIRSNTRRGSTTPPKAATLACFSCFGECTASIGSHATTRCVPSCLSSPMVTPLSDATKACRSDHTLLFIGQSTVSWLHSDMTLLWSINLSARKAFFTGDALRRRAKTKCLIAWLSTKTTTSKRSVPHSPFPARIPRNTVLHDVRSEFHMASFSSLSNTPKNSIHIHRSQRRTTSSHPS